MIAERGRKRRSEFTPFTPFSGFSVQALISRWFAVVRMHSRGRIWSLFSIAYQIPKLDVAGSNPVSRSKNQQPTSPGPLCAPIAI